jgi:hypothetical protein
VVLIVFIRLLWSVGQASASGSFWIAPFVEGYAVVAKHKMGAFVERSLLLVVVKEPPDSRADFRFPVGAVLPFHVEVVADADEVVGHVVAAEVPRDHVEAVDVPRHSLLSGAPRLAGQAAALLAHLVAAGAGVADARGRFRVRRHGYYPLMEIRGTTYGLGALIALLVLVCALILLLFARDAGNLREWTFGLIAALAVARLVP